MAPMDQAAWQVQRSGVACRLTQSVPRYGDAIFETVGGGRQSFVLRTKKNPMLGGPSELIAAAPSWNPTREPMSLGSIAVADSAEPLRLDAESSARLLDSLRDGFAPGFKRPLQTDTSEMASLSLSPINFLPAYRQYRDCVGRLLPVTFEQIENTVLEFAQEQTELSAQAQKKIDLMLRYISEDRSIKSFDVRAISSDKERLLDNLTLAKQRVQQVSEYLRSRGVDAGAITSSYRGERAGKNGAHQVVSIRVKRAAAN